MDFFFVLSGFVLSHTYSYRDQPTTILNFVGRRLARLYPYHIVTLMAFVLVQVTIGHGLPSYKDGTLATFIQQSCEGFGKGVGSKANLGVER